MVLQCKEAMTYTEFKKESKKSILAKLLLDTWLANKGPLYPMIELFISNKQRHETKR